MTAMERVTTNLALPQVDQAAILRHLNINPNDPAAQALIMVCQRYDLDPILKHALLIKGRLYVTRDGLLHVAHRSGVFDGMEVIDQGESQTHYTAKVSVWRKDMGRPFSYIGRYPKSGQIAKDYGPEMAVKVAEVMALRRAFDVALGAAEERWDEEAQQELRQADSGPQQPQEGPSEVRQESKPTPDNVDREKALQAWASRIGKAGAKLTEMGARDQATEILARFPWRTDPVQAEQAYLALCEAGVELRNARETQQAAVPVSQSDSLPTITQGKHGTFHWPPNDVIRETQQLPPHEEPVDAEFTPDPEAPAPIHDGQRKALMGYLKRAKVADTSEARAAFYAFMAPSDIQPGTNTNSLTFAQARGLLEVLGKMDGDELAATGQEFNAQFMRGQA